MPAGLAGEQAPSVRGDVAGVELRLLDPLGGAPQRRPAGRERPAVEHRWAPPDRALEPIQFFGLELDPTGVAADHRLEPRLAAATHSKKPSDHSRGPRDAGR